MPVIGTDTEAGAERVILDEYRAAHDAYSAALDRLAMAHVACRCAAADYASDDWDEDDPNARLYEAHGMMDADAFLRDVDEAVLAFDAAREVYEAAREVWATMLRRPRRWHSIA